MVEEKRPSLVAVDRVTIRVAQHYYDENANDNAHPTQKDKTNEQRMQQQDRRTIPMSVYQWVTMKWKDE